MSDNPEDKKPEEQLPGEPKPEETPGQEVPAEQVATPSEVVEIVEVEPTIPPVDKAKANLIELSTIVSQINLDDVKSLDVKKLREQMLKSIYILEHCLFSQAGMEFNRTGQIRAVLNTLEGILFTEEEIKRMDQPTKLRVYELQSRNLHMSLQFLQGLHKDVTSGLETLNSIEKVKMNKPAAKVVDGAVDKIKLDKIKQQVEQAIRAKLEEKKQEMKKNEQG